MFVFCIKGEAQIKRNSTKITLSANSIFTILPYYVIELLSVSEDIEIKCQFFSMDYIMNFLFESERLPLFNIRVHPLIKIAESEMSNIVDYHCFILKKSQIEHPYRKRIIRKLLRTLIVAIGGLYSTHFIIDSKQSTHQKKVVERFFQLLFEYSKEKKDVAFFADKLCLSAKYVSTLILKHTGSSILSWVNMFITLYAKHLLKSTSMTILQISEELKFPNPSFFCKFFKREAGVTPGEYRGL